MTLILGIDTSCDDTAASVVENGTTIHANVISSQTQFHEKYGGIVPEIAARKHIELIEYVIEDALQTADVTLPELDAIAVTNRPGLIPALLVGVASAKAIAYCHQIPLYPIHHIEGHIYANFLAHDEIPFPHLCLTVSGGHTSLIRVDPDWQYKVLGETIDDAAGEAYDKVAQYLGLGFPGGPVIDRLAHNGRICVEFPRPMKNSGDYRFSFSGLKTAVRNFVLTHKDALPAIEDIAASFQEAVADILVQKTLRAAVEQRIHAITLTGGVAANSRLREMMVGAARERNISVYYPPPVLCTDNAAMIAGVAFHHLKTRPAAALDVNASASGALG